MHRFLRGAVFAVAFAALSCSPPRIDGGDPERTRTTIAEARRSLSSERQPLFDRALKDLMYHADPLPLLSNPAVRAAINGKTAEEVIKAADDLRREENARRHDEQIRAEKAQIDGAFSSIAARDRAAAAKVAAAGGSASPLATPNGELTPAGLSALAALGAPITDTAAVIKSADPDVRDYCRQKTIKSPPIINFEVECVRDEMAGKKAVTGGLPNGVTAEVGQRIRDNCAIKYSGSYRDREACENTDAGSILNVGSHPEIMSQLSKTRQEELHRLMGH
jgi:hypothetical protein